MKKPRRNRIQCRKCKDVIESLYRHDYKECKCGAIFVDGGADYERCGWPGGKKMSDWIRRMP